MEDIEGEAVIPPIVPNLFLQYTQNGVIATQDQLVVQHANFLAEYNAESAVRIGLDNDERVQIRTRYNADIPLLQHYHINRRGELFENNGNPVVIPTVTNPDSIVPHYNFRVRLALNTSLSDFRAPVAEVVLDTFDPQVDLTRSYYVFLDNNINNNAYYNLRRFNQDELAQHFKSRLIPVLGPNELISSIMNQPHTYPLYLISSFGGVFSMNPEQIGGLNFILHNRLQMMNHYRSIRILDGTGTFRSTTIASLVATTFLGPKPPRHIIGYRDNNITNIALNNIFYRNFENGTNLYHRLIVSGKYGDINARRIRYFQINSVIAQPVEIQNGRNPVLIQPMMASLTFQCIGYTISNFGLIWKNGQVVPRMRYVYDRIPLVMNGVLKLFLVHRLVAFSFHSDTYSNQNCVVEHINKNPLDNYSGNLRWVSPSSHVSFGSPQRLLLNYGPGKLKRRVFRTKTDAARITNIENIENVLAKADNGVHVFMFRNYLGIEESATISYYHSDNEADDLDQHERNDPWFELMDE